VDRAQIDRAAALVDLGERLERAKALERRGVDG
jgi:hypothetical protein